MGEGSVYNAQGRLNRLAVMCIDAYGVAVKNGFVGTVEEWLASLKGDPGESYVLTDSDKAEIAALAAAYVPRTTRELVYEADVTGTSATLDIEPESWMYTKSDEFGYEVEITAEVAEPWATMYYTDTLRSRDASFVKALVDNGVWAYSYAERTVDGENRTSSVKFHYNISTFTATFKCSYGLKHVKVYKVTYNQ